VVYIDSSSLLKLIWLEPESEAVRGLVDTEDAIVVSSLAELEVDVQLTAAWLAGRYSAARWRRYRERIASLRKTEPFGFRTLPGSVFDVALRQQREAGRAHCRAVDRLHLAAMAELDVTRLMTHDMAQAAAARAAGFEVVMPGR
jgi:predicted nucleic acid-binding protein